MPYIKQDSRDYLDAGMTPATAGELNYALTQLVNRYLGPNPNYQLFNDALGALTGCQLELYRRRVSPYEDLKIGENGDIPEYATKSSFKEQTPYKTEVEYVKTEVVKLAPTWDGGSVQIAATSEILWDFRQLEILKIWSEFGVQGEGVNVYVIDTGCAPHHMIGSNMVASTFLSTGDPLDENGHGTWVVGKIAAQGVGIAPECNIYSLRVLGADGSGSVADTTAALRWVLKQPAPHIINMSLGSTSSSYAQRQVIAELVARGITIVAAAGNENTGEPCYPAAYPDVIAVAATDENDNRAWFSNYGGNIVVAAPGVSCYSTYLNEDYRKLQGTSMASPTVAALMTLGASLYLQHTSDDKSKMREDLYAALVSSCKDLGEPGKDAYYGYGDLSGYTFMKEVQRLAATR